MRVFNVLLCLVSFFLSSCSTLPASFSSENVMKIQQGMSSDEILEMFGEPKSVSVQTCGTSTPNPWSCTTWEYGQYGYHYASFTFAGNPGALLLNNYKVDRDQLYVP
ncbi:MAG: hypothetical protein GC137_10440 [Alphaproteobacteria bacterium]|nr:hypothetical protein [Alphaproteobacteria bacterium]